MPVSVKDIASARRRVTKFKTFNFNGFDYGLNTVSPIFHIEKNELSEAINVIYQVDGFETRPAITSLTTTATTGGSTVVLSDQVNIAGTNRTLIQDTGSILYYASGAVPVVIGPLEGQAKIVPYNDVGLVMDTSYLKYLDGVASTNLKICYDGGTGNDGYQYTNLSGSEDSFLALGNGTNEAVVQIFTTQTWTAGETIPTTLIAFKLQKVGDGYTGTDNRPINVRLREKGTGSYISDALVEETLVETASEISTTATEYSVSVSNVITELSQNTTYYLSIEYDNGDGTNYIKVISSDADRDGGAYYATSVEISNTGAAVVDDDCADDDTANWSLAIGGGPTITFDTDHYELNNHGTQNEIYYIGSLSLTTGYWYEYEIDVKDGTATGAEIDLVSLNGTDVERYETFITTGVNTTINFSFAATGNTDGVGIRIADIDLNLNIEIKNVTLYRKKMSLEAKQYDYGKNVICAIQPGRPPKGSFGTTNKSRAYVADPDNPSYLRYSNLTHLDWSTSSGGGYISTIGGGTTGYEIGGLAVLFGDLFIFGKEELPFFASLTGSAPSSYAINYYTGRAWSTHNTVTNIPNNIWIPSGDGISAVTGVTEYGDVRLDSVSDPILDRIKDNWSTSGCVAGYDPKNKLFLLAFPNYHRVLCAYVGKPVQDRNTGQYRYRWSELEFYRYEYTSSTYKWTLSGNGTNEYRCELATGGDPSLPDPDAVVLNGSLLTEGTLGALSDHEYDYGDNDALGYSTIYFRDDSGDPDTTGITLKSVIIPTSFGTADGVLIFGASDGKVYQFTTSTYYDMASIEIDPRWKTGFIEIPFTNIYTAQYQPLIRCTDSNGSYNVDIYRNDSQTVFKTHAHTIYSAASAVQNRQWKNVAMDAMSFQFGVDTVSVSGKKTYFKDLIMRYRSQSY